MHRGLWRMSRRRVAGWLAASLALVGVSIVLDACAYLESKFIYYPTRTPFLTPRGVEDVWFETDDGLRLHGWFIPARGRKPGDAPGPAVLHVHGNAGTVADHAAFTEFLSDAGVGVLLFDYRSFGRSDAARGRLGRADLVEDADGALDYLLSRPGVDPRRVGIFGFSLGGVIGLSVAAERPEVRSVVSVAAFASWRGIAMSHAGWTGALLLRSGHDAEGSGARLGGRPLLIVHGDADTTVPVGHARRIAGTAMAAGVPIETAIVPGAGHVDVLDADHGTPDTIAAFFRRTLGVADETDPAPPGSP